MTLTCIGHDSIRIMQLVLHYVGLHQIQHRPTDRHTDRQTDNQSIKSERRSMVMSRRWTHFLQMSNSKPSSPASAPSASPVLSSCCPWYPYFSGLCFSLSDSSIGRWVNRSIHITRQGTHHVSHRIMWCEDNGMEDTTPTTITTMSHHVLTECRRRCSSSRPHRRPTRRSRLG